MDNAKALKQVKSLMLEGRVLAARDLICAAAKVSAEERNHAGEEDLPRFILRKTKNVNIARMLQVERAFNTVYRAFGEEGGDYHKEKALEELNLVEPLMRSPEKLELYYWKGRCVAALYPEREEEAAVLFKRAIEFSSYHSKSPYLRYAAREISQSRISDEEKLRYTELVCRKMPPAEVTEQHHRYLDGLRRRCYNQALAAGRNTEGHWYEREKGYTRALELLNEVRVSAAEKYQRRIGIYGALSRLYLENGAVEKAGQMYRRRQEAVYSASREKNSRTGVWIDSTSQNYR